MNFMIFAPPTHQTPQTMFQDGRKGQGMRHRPPDGERAMRSANPMNTTRTLTELRACSSFQSVYPAGTSSLPTSSHI